MKEGSKYHPLYVYLRQSDQETLTLTLADIEALGITLPPSARMQRAWWSNRSKGALQARAWMGAGYHVVDIDLELEQVTFAKPVLRYTIERQGDMILWNGGLVRALRQFMGFTQAQLAEEMGVRQETISEWENGVYTPSRASSKHLSLIAERAGFLYEIEPDAGEKGADTQV